MANNILLKFPRQTTTVIINHVQRRHMPVNVPPTATGKRRFRLEVETDPHKLVNYCCGLNYHLDEPLVKLKPDNEYPDWLWNLRLTEKPNSWDMEKGTKEYYLRLAEEGNNRNYLLKMRSRKPTKMVGKVLLDEAEYKHRLRFAVLAYMEDDVGLEQNSMETDWWSSYSVGKQEKLREYYLPMKKDKVLYMDKIEGNIRLKNYFSDYESTFKGQMRNLEKRPPIHRSAIQDSKRRHPHSVF